MQLKVAEGIKMDVCEEDGVWLDKGELEELLKVAKKRGQEEGFLSSVFDRPPAY